MYEVFDLVICFVGSAACSPTLEAMMEAHPKWDTRMFFSHWNQPLIDKLQDQQEKLKKAGIDRQVLILMDDVILTGKATDQLAHLCMRGRHFNISVMMAAVSYTSISKRSRRSLDFLLVFSCPMQGDRKVLSWEYAQNSSTADWVMNNLEENQCLVFETSRKLQRGKFSVYLCGRVSFFFRRTSGLLREGQGYRSSNNAEANLLEIAYRKSDGLPTVEELLLLEIVRNFRDCRKTTDRMKKQA